MVPVLSLQPLVENAVRHGVESRRSGGLVEILGRDLGADVELRVSDDGAGHRPGARDGGARGRGRRHRAAATCTGGCSQTFGELRARGSSQRRSGTTVVMTLPKFRAGVRAA